MSVERGVYRCIPFSSSDKHAQAKPRAYILTYTHTFKGTHPPALPYLPTYTCTDLSCRVSTGEVPHADDGHEGRQGRAHPDVAVVVW